MSRTEIENRIVELLCNEKLSVENAGYILDSVKETIGRVTLSPEDIESMVSRPMPFGLPSKNPM